MSSDLSSKLSADRDLVERWLEMSLSKDESTLSAAVRYAVLPLGKGLRAALCLWAAQAFASEPDLSVQAALPCAAAIELVHGMTLIYDDLPGMDNSELRRGRASTWMKFGEGAALLSGAAMLAQAFKFLSACSDSAVIVDDLAVACHELAAGQLRDIELSRQAQSPSVATLVRLHNLKTASLIRFAVTAGARIGGATPPQCAAMGNFGAQLGLAYQIRDDVLDATGTAENLGKPSGQDTNKHTFVTCCGLAEANAWLRNTADEAINSLAMTGLSESAQYPFKGVLKYAVERDR